MHDEPTNTVVDRWTPEEREQARKAAESRYSALHPVRAFSEEKLRELLEALNFNQ